MVHRDDNPNGVPIEGFDGIRAGSLADRSQTYQNLADGPFFGNNRPGVQISAGIRDAFWLQLSRPPTITDPHKEQLSQDLLAFLNTHGV